MLEGYIKFKQIIEKYRLEIGLVSVVTIIFIGAGLFFVGNQAKADNNKTIKSSDLANKSLEINIADTQTQASANEDIIFDIEGGVVNPGVYKLKNGSVISDAIGLAGGFNIEADRERISRELNQASIIGKNAKVYIFKNSDRDVKVVYGGSSNQAISSASSSGASNDNISNKKVNLNKANLQELDTLAKIGPALAQRIIDWREANGGYEVIEDIKKVKGIGDSVYEGIKDSISIE